MDPALEERSCVIDSDKLRRGGAPGWMGRMDIRARECRGREREGRDSGIDSEDLSLSLQSSGVVATRGHGPNEHSNMSLEPGPLCRFESFIKRERSSSCAEFPLG